MNIAQRLERSKRRDTIDFSKISCLNELDELVAIYNLPKIVVEPIWLRKHDLEGLLYAKYRETHPAYTTIYLRYELWKRLQRVAQALPEDRKLIVRAGHRPADVQNGVLQSVICKFKRDNPDANEEQALQHARMYVSDPAIKLPPHCCGTAVDVDMLDTNRNQLVDFGGPVNEDSEISHIYCPSITPEQVANRQLLLRAMLGAGFASYYAEWWHFSYGDQIWAWFYHHDACLYGLIDI